MNHPWNQNTVKIRSSVHRIGSENFVHRKTLSAEYFCSLKILSAEYFCSLRYFNTLSRQAFRLFQMIFRFANLYCAFIVCDEIRNVNFNINVFLDISRSEYFKRIPLMFALEIILLIGTAIWLYMFLFLAQGESLLVFGIQLK